MHFDHLASQGISLFSFIVSVGTAIGVVWHRRGIFNRVRLALENEALREENGRLRDALTAANQTVEAWRARVDPLIESIETMKIELADSVLYIVDLVVFMKSGRSIKEMPTPPERLKETLAKAMLTRSEQTENA